jgi:hypothetical protein
MIVVYFHLPGSSVAPDEADSPLIVDANAVLSTAVSGKGLQAIAWRDPQVVQSFRVVQHHQLLLCSALNVRWELPDTATFGDRSRVVVAVASDYGSQDSALRY